MRQEDFFRTNWFGMVRGCLVEILCKNCNAFQKSTREKVAVASPRTLYPAFAIGEFTLPSPSNTTTFRTTCDKFEITFNIKI